MTILWGGVPTMIGMPTMSESETSGSICVNWSGNSKGDGDLIYAAKTCLQNIQTILVKDNGISIFLKGFNCTSADMV